MLLYGVHNFRKLTVWNRSRIFAQEVYLLTARVVRPEQRAISAQLRRAALSIPANIAEGCGKGSRAETIRYLEIACGSVAESEHHLQIAADLAILPGASCATLADEAQQLRRMLRALIARLPS
ncbi:four helix bundle protein [soil metagenome]